MFGIGTFEEFIVVLVIILSLVGGKKLSELSRDLSESIRDIRKGFREDTCESAQGAGVETNNEQDKV